MCSYSLVQQFIFCSFVKLFHSFMHKHTLSHTHTHTHTQTDIFIHLHTALIRMCVRNKGCCWVCCFLHSSPWLLAEATEAWRICLHSIPRPPKSLWHATETETLDRSCLVEWIRVDELHYRSVYVANLLLHKMWYISGKFWSYKEHLLFLWRLSRFLHWNLIRWCHSFWILNSVSISVQGVGLVITVITFVSSVYW